MFLITAIRPYKNQPRTWFSPSELRATARSLTEVGQQQPVKLIRVNGSKDKWELIDGERRWQASQLCQAERIWGVVEERDLSEKDKHMSSLVSNFCRQGHTHMETAIAFQTQVSAGTSVKELANAVGKSEPYVYLYLKLTGLIPELQAKMHPTTPDEALLRMMEAVVIAALPKDKQEKAYRLALKHPLKLRLSRLREHAEVITGKTRKGRPRDYRNRFLTFVDGLDGTIQIIMDMRQGEFKRAITNLSNPQRKDLSERLNKLRSSVDQLIQAVGRPL